jgi:hypothetical protein
VMECRRESNQKLIRQTASFTSELAQVWIPATL